MNHNQVVDVGTPSPQFQEWAMTEVRFHGFADLPTARNVRAKSSTFTCLGRQWCLGVYPGGNTGSDDGMVGLFLFNLSDKSIKIKYHLNERTSENTFGPNHGHGTPNFTLRSSIMDSLVGGALVIQVRMQPLERVEIPSIPFIPENPLCNIMLKLFMDEKSADVVFEVGAQGAKNNATKKTKISPTTFFAHRFILEKCAPQLEEMCGSGEDKSTPVSVSIPDIKPDIFNHVLYYVYGGKISDEDLKSHAKDIIDAADKFGISNLKLEAEACLVNSTEFSVENMMEHLLYADAKNCALLKEAVMDFIVANKVEVLAKISFKDAPVSPTMITDLLTAMARGEKKIGNEATNEDQIMDTMRISDLRRKVHEKGLDIDGSRETLIASLKENS